MNGGEEVKGRLPGVDYSETGMALRKIFRGRGGGGEGRLPPQGMKRKENRRKGGFG